MHRWGRCAGSLAAASSSSDDSSSEFAREGTAAHTLGERALQYADQGRKAHFWIGQTITVKYTENDVIKSQDFVVDEEMADFVQVYADQVLREPGELIIEERLDLSQVYGVENQFGTGDAIVLDHENKRLYVGDLKFGRGVQVYAADNEQLLSYGAGAFLAYDMVEEWETITVAIHQPRLYHYDEVTVTRAEMLAFIEQAKAKAKQAIELVGADPVLIEQNKTPGEKQCQWCPIKSNCEALAKWTHEQVFEDFTTLKAEPTKVREPARLSDELIGLFWARRDTISNWISEIQSEVKRRLEAGSQIPGLKLVAGRAGARKYSSEEEAEQIMKAARIKMVDMYTMKVLSPTQAEKAFEKKKPKVWAKLNAIVTQAPGAPAVAPASDRRPELKIAKSEQFADESDISDLI